MKKNIIIVLLFVLILLVLLFFWADNRKVKLKYIQDVEIASELIKDNRWLSIGGQKVKDEIEISLNIRLPDINYDEYTIYLGYGREIKKIEYSLITKYFLSNHSKDKYYPGRVILSDEYMPGTIYIYMGDKFVPRGDCNTSYQIGDEIFWD